MSLLSNPLELPQMSDQDLVVLYDRTRIEEDELHSQAVTIRQELRARLDERKLKSTIAGQHAITAFDRITFRTSVEEARDFGAVKTKEVTDTVLLRKLYDAGEKIPGVQVTPDARITSVKE